MNLPFGEPRRSLVICFTGSILPRSLERSRFVSLLVAAPSAAAAFAPVVPGSVVVVGSALVSRQRLTGSRPPAWDVVHARPDGPALDHSGDPASLVVNARTVRRFGSGGSLRAQEKPHESASAEHGRRPQRAGLLGRAVLQPPSLARGRVAPVARPTWSRARDLCRARARLGRPAPRSARHQRP